MLTQSMSETISVEQQYQDGKYAQFAEKHSLALQSCVHHSLVQAIKEKYENINQVKILDFGCGHGLLSRSINAELPNASIIGLDQSSAMINHAKKTDQITYIKGNILDYTFEDDDIPFDCIVSCFVLCHIPSVENLQELFKKLFKITKEEGLLGCIIPALDTERSGVVEPSGKQVELKLEENSFIPLYDYEYNQETLKFAAESAGYTKVNIQSCIFPQDKQHLMQIPIKPILLLACK